MSKSNFLVFFVLLVCLQLASTCFLNSCPYRRYGRTLRCKSCGINQGGICKETKCCFGDACIEHPECEDSLPCPELFCQIDRHPGYCVEKGTCCTQGGCERSAMCY